MKRVLVAGILALAACRTAAPVVSESAPAPPDAFGFVEGLLESGEHVERMHSEPGGYAALLANGDAYRLVRVAWDGESWTVIATTPAQTDYLWPGQ